MYGVFHLSYWKTSQEYHFLKFCLMEMPSDTPWWQTAIALSFSLCGWPCMTCSLAEVPSLLPLVTPCNSRSACWKEREREQCDRLFSPVKQWLHPISPHSSPPPCLCSSTVKGSWAKRQKSKVPVASCYQTYSQFVFSVFTRQDSLML